MAVLLAILLGWLLKAGKGVLLPVFAAIIVVYVLVSATEALGQVPLLGRLPEWLRRLLVLGVFVAVVVALGAIVTSTVGKLVTLAPTYQANLERMLNAATAAIGLGQSTDWNSLRAATLGKIDVQALLGTVLGSIGSMAGMVFMVLVYALFLMGERSQFARKLATALPGESAEQTKTIIRDINDRIGQYLAIKTLVNIILGVLSYLIMLAFGLDFALFWALVIALLNYIPYVGSMLGVLFPVLLALAQFGSFSTMLALAALLSAAQAVVGNVLEPRLIGRQVNLSPFVVLLALSLWSSLWGVAGAILAIPLTSMLAIVLGAFGATRPLAVLLADDVSMYESGKPQV